MAKIIIIFLSFLCLGAGLRAQDPEFSQYYAAPVYLNPAMAGISYGPRFTAVYRNQWPGLGNGINGGFVTYFFSYDQHFEPIKGGIALSILANQLANGVLSNYKIGLTYSFQARLGDNLGLKLGIEGVFTQRRLNWDKLLLADATSTLSQFNGLVTLPSVGSLPVPGNLNRIGGDINAGAVLFSEKLFAGFTVKHILQPNEAFVVENEAKLPIRFAAHTGAVVPINPGKGRNTYFSPNVAYIQQSGFNQLNFGAILNIELVYAGLWFRHTFANSDAVIAQIGIAKNIMRLGYSYDISVSDISTTNSRGAHELALSINLSGNDNSLNPRNRSGILKCPAILNF